MRQVLFLSSLVVAAAACGGGSTSAGSGGGAATSPAPASAPAATSSASATTSGGANPCAAGTCKIALEFETSIQPELARKQANYKVYKGCPRSYGVTIGAGLSATDARGFAAQPPMYQSPLPILSLPPFEGNAATVVIFLGATAHKFLVVDFSKGPSQTAKLPYAYTAQAAGTGDRDERAYTQADWSALSGAQLQPDLGIDRTNASNARKICTA